MGNEVKKWQVQLTVAGYQLPEISCKPEPLALSREAVLPKYSNKIV